MVEMKTVLQKVDEEAGVAPDGRVGGLAGHIAGT